MYVKIYLITFSLKTQSLSLFLFARSWDHKDKRWYYHSSEDGVTTEDTGYTGGLVVVFLIILLTLYSLRRLWVVWAEILNFDGLSGNVNISSSTIDYSLQC